MPQTHASINLHVVHGTKGRLELIPPEIMPRLCAYLGGVAHHRKAMLLAAGGMPDHLHMLLSVHPTTAPSDLVRDLKANSSRWFRETLGRRFAWQAGFGEFAVSASNLDVVRRYINNQAKHHAKMSFVDEYLAMLKRHRVEYDPRYVFD